MKLSALRTPVSETSAALAAASLPIDDLDRPDVRMFAFRSIGDVVGYGGLERCGTATLLRSVVVLPPYRGDGVGSAIVSGLLDIAAVEARSAYLLTTDAAGFFQKFGFTEIDRAAAPAEIRASSQMAMLCPASAVLMHRSLP